MAKKKIDPLNKKAYGAVSAAPRLRIFLPRSAFTRRHLGSRSAAL